LETGCWSKDSLGLLGGAMKRMATAVFIFITLFLSASCSPGKLFGPTITPLPTHTYTPSRSPTITNTPTIENTPTRTSTSTKTATTTPIAIVDVGEKIVINENLNMTIHTFMAQKVNLHIFSGIHEEFLCSSKNKYCYFIMTMSISGKVTLDDIDEIINVSAFTDDGEIGTNLYNGLIHIFAMAKPDSGPTEFILWAYVFNSDHDSITVRINDIEIIDNTFGKYDFYDVILG
jgi:hypothetical protein